MNPVSKQILAIGLPVVTVAVTGVAVAYWSNTGSGVGSASTAIPVAVDVAQDTTITGMGPGVTPTTITVTVSNPGTTSVQIDTVVASISSVVKAVGAPAGTCDLIDYSLTGATMTVSPAVVLGAGGTTTFTGAALGFANDAARNQDACKGATVNLAYAASDAP